MCVMVVKENINAEINQMRILQCALSGTVLMDTGNVKMGYSVYMRDLCVMELITAMTNQMRIMQCVLNI